MRSKLCLYHLFSKLCVISFLLFLVWYIHYLEHYGYIGKDMLYWGSISVFILIVIYFVLDFLIQIPIFITIHEDSIEFNYAIPFRNQLIRFHDIESITLDRDSQENHQGNTEVLEYVLTIRKKDTTEIEIHQNHYSNFLEFNQFLNYSLRNYKSVH